MRHGQFRTSTWDNAIWVVVGILFLLAATGGRGDDFPIRRFSSFTWVVDYEPFWSPDSKQIVLVSSRHGGMKVHVMDAKSESHGSDMRQLTTGDAEDDSPAWSPDGRFVAYNGPHGIYRKATDGGAPQELLLRSETLRTALLAARDGREAFGLLLDRA